MSAEILQLPRPLPLVELEARVVGAALLLGMSLSDFEALGIAAEDFRHPLHSKAWSIARKKAQHGLIVSGSTVASAGREGRWFSPAEAEEVERLQHLSILSRDEFKQVAADFRLGVQRARTITALEGQLQQLRAGVFNPARSASNLEAIAHQLQRDTAPDEDATGDVIELLYAWDENERTSKSRLLPTRILALDVEYGGLPPGLTVFAAAPGVGKTAVMDSMIRAQLEADPSLHLGFFGLEDGTSHVARRWMAHETGMLLREVGWKERTPEQRRLSGEAAEKFKPLLERLHVYRHDTITAPELVARIASMRARHGIAAAYVDNLTEVDFAAQQRGRNFPDKEHTQVAELGRQLRNFGLREAMPIGLIAHTIGALKAGDIPSPQDIAGGQALGRRVRLFVGMWAKGDAIRATISKANELGPSGVTIEFARFASAGLIDPKNGAKVNLQQERAIESAQKEREKADRRAKAAAETKARLAAEKAEKEAAKPAEDAQTQLELDEANRKANEAAVEKPSLWGFRQVDGERESEE